MTDRGYDNLYPAHNHTIILFQPKHLNVFQEQSLQEKGSHILIHAILFNTQPCEKNSGPGMVYLFTTLP